MRALSYPYSRLSYVWTGSTGRAHYLRILQQKQIPYITRCREHHQLLKDPGVKAQLAKAPQQKYEHPDSPEVSRELFDIPM